MANNSFSFYPSLEDQDFNKKIHNKREFQLNKTKKINSNKEFCLTKETDKKTTSCQTKKNKNLIDLDRLATKLCKFNLSNNQKFLKTFLAPNTPYNSILLFHGTGVGKTCSSISIAENFKDYLISNNKKVHVLLNPSIRDNFKRNIFNIEKFKDGKVEEQCTKSRLLKETSIKPSDSYEIISKKINKIINNRYKFLGYIEFSNLVRNLKKFNQEIFEKKIKEIFSNTVMIIDEVHNIKEGNTKDGKKLPAYLLEILGIADNMKLILLSATPMFDKAEEIIFILNLLLTNDKRDTIRKLNMFDTKGKITPHGEMVLLEKSRGYISYLRGEHPLKFPKRLYPDQYNDKQLIKQHEFPSVDINNNKIPKDERIQNLKIIGCEMKGYQLAQYQKMDIKTSDDDYGSFNINGLMASNIVYPDLKKAELIKDLIGDSGLSKIVKKTKNKYSFLKEEYKDFFDKKTIGQYSTKISNILNNIEECKTGIVFIYSRFLGSGILPLALTLELNGYSNYEGSLIDNEKKNDKKYILITGDNELSKNSYINYLKIEHENNKGQKVKVIIGSETAAEGLDFKYIREVHILDPWFHMNKSEQVIGRAIRNCSHINLPFKQRNVLVYLYASTVPKKYETIDLKMYRISEQKSKNIAEVEYLIKTNAIDCGINKEMNRFTDKIYKKKFSIETSRGTKHEVGLNDLDQSRICNFKNCDFKCVYESDSPASNSNTLDYRFIEDNIDEIKKFLKTFFTKQFFYTLTDLKKLYSEVYSEKDYDLLYYSLNEIVEKSEVLKDPYHRVSLLERVGSKYIVKPKYIKGQFATINNLRFPQTKKRRYIDTTNQRLILTKNTTGTSDTGTRIYQKQLDKIYNSKKKIIEDRLKKTTEVQKKNTLMNQFIRIKENNLFNFEYSYLDTIKKQMLIETLIQRDAKKSLSDDGLDAQMVQHLENHLLYFNRDLGIRSKPNSAIFGYKIAVDESTVVYFAYKDGKDGTDGTFPLVDKQSKLLILKQLKKTIENENPQNKIIIYMSTKKGKMYVKIKENNPETTKLRNFVSGSICGNEGMNKFKIVEYINKIRGDIYPSISAHIPGKDLLCLELDLYMRLNEVEERNNLRWFFSAEEAIERGINLKKLKKIKN